MILRDRRAFSIMEYFAVLLLVMGALLIMGSYIHRAMQGRYRQAGEAFADLRQHEAQASQDCVCADQLNIWYSEKCFDHYILQSCGLGEMDDVNLRAYCRQSAAVPGACDVAKCANLCCQQGIKTQCQICGM